MKKALFLSLVVLLAACLSLGAFHGVESRAAIETTPARTQLTSVEVPMVPSITKEMELENTRLMQRQEHHDKLKQYVFDAMTEWAPAKDMPDQDTSNFDGIAEDIVTVVLDDSEPPLWSDDLAKGKTATMVATIGLWEGHYWRYVDDGRCNSKTWRDSHAGKHLTGPRATCDGGHAYSIFQIHPDRGGIVLTTKEIETPQGPKFIGDGYTYHQLAPDEPYITGRDLIQDRTKAVRVALHMIRPAIHNNLCSYTGESGDCPKGKERIKWAMDWWKKHPFPPIDS
jgi:hypothetical protein